MCSTFNIHALCELQDRQKTTIKVVKSASACPQNAGSICYLTSRHKMTYEDASNVGSANRKLIYYCNYINYFFSSVR